ncbi:MAG: Ig-like domain-containing protein [Actinomycetota bacterium]|nr:Ig-like domain-containing protein [Actinomycetota bacterium]
MSRFRPAPAHVEPAHVEPAQLERSRLVRLRRPALVLLLVAVLAPLVLPPAPAGAAPGGQRRTVEGVLRLLAADTAAAPAHDHRWHGHSSDAYRQVLVAGRRPYFLSGRTGTPNTRVRVSGLVSGQRLTAETVQTLSTASELPSTGTTRTLLVLAHWSEPDDMTPERAREQMFGDTAAWYADASYGALAQTGHVTPWVRIAGPYGGQCFADHLEVMEQAKTAAAGVGFDPGAYDNVVVYFPDTPGQPGSDCGGYGGWAYVGAPGAWLHGFLDRRVTVHEQGHNYGLHHSHSYPCTSVVSGTCTFSDYGDDLDAMGAAAHVGHFNAAQKQLLGWLGGRSADLTYGGTTTLAPLAGDTGTVAAVVRAPGGRSYWLEHRQPVDGDSSLPPGGTDGVLLRVRDPAIGNGDPGASLLDARPGDGLSALSATLRPGTSWTTPEGAVIALGTVGPAGAALSVRSADRTPPTVQRRTPGSGATAVAPGSSVAVTFSEPVRGVSTSTFRLTDEASGAPVPGRVAQVDGAWVLDPDADLARDRRWRVTLTGGATAVRDRSGNPLAMTTWTFTTGPRPSVTGRAPGSGATGVSRYATVSATFSEAVRGVGTDTFRLTNAATGATVTATVVRGSTSRTWLLDPATRLARSTRYTVRVVGGRYAVRDAAGNPLRTTGWSFTTSS